jgi:curved DNA-binding protein CbpA
MLKNVKHNYVFNKIKFFRGFKYNLFCEINQELEKNFLKLDYYSILNLDSNAKDLEIKKNYLHLAKKFHPDKFKGSPEIFKKISDAYYTLKDPIKREDYNKRLKIKRKRKYKEKQHKKENQEKENTVMQEFSKYEEDFKKINIEKEFTQFTKTKIKTTPDEIKTFREDMEKNMTKREYQIRQFLNAVQEEQKKNKSISYQFYKSIGLVNEEKLKSNKSYDQLVKDEINKIKNKFKINEEIKIEEKKMKEESDKEDKSLIHLVYSLFILYVIVICYVLYKRQINKKLEEQMKLDLKERINSERMRKYLYIESNNK